MTEGRRAFLVEDEPMIRMLIEDMLKELGYVTVAEAGDIDHALSLARTTEFDVAILDVNLKGQIITPVAELLDSLDLPFIFATGYGADGVPAAFRNHTSVQKPFQIDALLAAINAVCDLQG